MSIQARYKLAYETLTNGCYDYEGPDPIGHIQTRFESEYGWAIERYGRHKALTDWLAGMALDIPYTYHDIMDTFGMNEKQAQRYFDFMAMCLQELFDDRANRIDKPHAHLWIVA
jgi:hypothetical protein